MNWKVLVIGVVPVVFLVAILALNMQREPRFVSNNLEGDCPRLDGQLKTLQGEGVELADLEGSPLVLNFWSTKCVSCKVEHEDLLETRRLFERRGVNFYGVMWHDTVERGQAWLKMKKAEGDQEFFPILIDQGDRLAIELGVMATPETFVINAEGCVNRKFTGPITVDQLAAELEPLL